MVDPRPGCRIERLWGSRFFSQAEVGLEKKIGVGESGRTLIAE